MSLGENIKRIRLDRGLSQTQLAERAGLSKSMVSNIERGSRKTSYNKLGELARALNCHVNELIGDDYLSREKIDEDAWLYFADRMHREGYTLEDVERWVKFAKQFVEQDTKQD